MVLIYIISAPLYQDDLIFTYYKTMSRIVSVSNHFKARKKFVKYIRFVKNNNKGFPRDVIALGYCNLIKINQLSL